MVSCSAPDPTSDLLAELTFANPMPRPVFELTDTQGHPFEFSSETKGSLTLLYFGYTHCPDICPVQLSQIANVLRDDPQLASNTTVVFVSVDPARDTPEVIERFLANFDERFIGLTGSGADLDIAQKAAGLPTAVKSTEDDDYEVAHASQVLVWAPDGLMRSQYPFGTRQTTWEHDLRLLASLDPEK